MASKRFEKGSEEWEIFSNYWKICQLLWEAEDSEEYWNLVVKSMGDFCEKYKGNNELFAKNIMIALVETLDEKEKRKSVNNQNQSF